MAKTNQKYKKKKSLLFDWQSAISGLNWKAMSTSHPKRPENGTTYLNTVDNHIRTFIDGEWRILETADVTAGQGLTASSNRMNIYIDDIHAQTEHYSYGWGYDDSGGTDQHIN